MPNVAALLAYLMVASLVAWAARMYLRDARAYRAGEGDERYAWLRRSHPDHPALPPAPPKPLLRMLPQRWGWRHVTIAAVQVAAIGGGMWLSFLAEPRPLQPPPSQAYGVVLFGWIILVAFATAVLTRVWDLSRAALAGRRTGTRQRQEAMSEAEGVLAPRRRLGEGA